ncbi:MAG: gliding motility-associated C-terminal domain-containing protein [Chitinophagales bacterium]
MISFWQQKIGKKVFEILFFLFLTNVCIFAQKEGNIWHFGDNAGLDFNSGTPIALTNGALSTTEGCASISDSNGNLLFYTEGTRVWNRNHQVMFNGYGLDGHDSATQSAIIVPKPASDNLYYVFTVAQIGEADGLRYSVIDMNLQGGLGEITIKNEQLATPVAEKITAVLHNNNTDIWLIAHEWNSDAFYAYQITPTTINAPIVSNIGTVHTGGAFLPNNNAAGYMKVSPDGSKIAVAIKEMNLFEILDFDNNTGMVSNPITTADNYTNAYGVEFSSDGSKLYLSHYSWTTSYIYQLDLQASNILQTATLINTSDDLGGALQIASDGKIYFSRHESHYLGVINSPNLAGTACNYVEDGVFLGTANATFGFPTFVQSFFFTPFFTYENTCFGENMQFNISNTENITNVIWNFGDINSATSNTSNQLFPMHIFSDAGSFEVSLTFTQNGLTETISETIVINPLPEQPNLGDDMSLCNGENFVLSAGSNNPSNSYLWQDGSTNSNFVVTQAGTYSVQISNFCGTVSDVITISYSESPSLDLGNDVSLCEGESLVLNQNNNANNSAYLWQDGSTNPTFAVTDAGTYSLQMTNNCGTVSDQINVFYGNAPQISLPNDTSLCNGQNILLDVNLNNSNISYLWQDGSANPSFLANAAGLYSVTVTSSCGSATDDFLLTYNNFPPSVNLPNDTLLCDNATLILNANTNPSDAEILWSDGSTNETFTVAAAGTYSLQISTLCGVSSDNITVSYDNTPFVNLPNDTNLCNGETLVLNASLPFVTNYLWQDGSTNPIYTVTEAGFYEVEISTNCGTVSDNITVSYTNEPTTFSLGNDTNLCVGDTLLLSILNNENWEYEWQNGENSNSFEVTETGIYALTVSNNCGTFTDSIAVNFGTPPLPFSLPNDTSFCDFGSLLLEIPFLAENTSFEWQNGENNSSFLITEAGTYWLETNNFCGTFSDSISVSIKENPQLNLGTDLSLCDGDTVLLNVYDVSENLNEYVWQNGSTDSIFTITETGFYALEGSNDCGTLQDTIDVFFNTKPTTFDLGNDTTICEGTGIYLSLENDLNENWEWRWQDGSFSDDFLATETDIYALTASNECGESSDSVFVNVENCELGFCAWKVPTAFSPNADNRNDFLQPIFNCEPTNWYFTVYNRWGEQVFESNDITQFWNGMYEEKTCDIGVYAWYFRVEWSQDDKEQFFFQKGNVSLIR